MSHRVLANHLARSIHHHYVAVVRSSTAWLYAFPSFRMNTRIASPGRTMASAIGQFVDIQHCHP